MAWVKHKLGKLFPRETHETVWHVLYKVVDTKTPYLKKLIIRSINHQRKKDLARTGVFLVRDGFIVKPCKRKDKSLIFLARDIGYKMPIRSLNLGALYKKYNIPKSTGKIIAASDTPHTLAINFKYLFEVLDGSVDNANKVLSIVSDGLIGQIFHKRRRATVIELLTYLSTERKIEMLCDAFICDTAASFLTISLSARQHLVNFDWTQPARRIHDDLARICDRLTNPDRYTPIPYKEETVKSISDANTVLSNGLRLKLAENGMDLLDWGQHLSHCIGGYTGRAVTGAANESCILLGVYEGENERPTWTIQMKAVGERAKFWSIVQFYGKYNSPPPPETRKQVEEGLLFSRSEAKRKEYENKVLSGSGV